MSCRRVSFVAGLLIALGGARVAEATLVLPVGLEQMTRESEVIVHAEVLDQQIAWSKDKARVLTLTRLRVLDGIKGATKGASLTIYQVGGTLDGVTFNIPGALRFTPGEEMIFFATRFGGMVVSYGMGLGKYQVYRRDGTTWVEAQFGDVGFVRPAPGGQWVHTEPPAAGPYLLPEFVSRVQAILAGGGR